MSEQNKKGTTTVGVICKDSVILAADQLASIGDFKFNKATKKIHKISKNIALTTAGSVGDNLSIVRLLEAQMKLYSLENGLPTVKSAVTLMANILSNKYQSTYLPYHLFNLIAGHDEKPRLYSIDPVGGIGEEKKFASTGSGMTIAYGILDSNYKSGMSSKDGVKLAVNSIVAARKRVGSVGGENITVIKISESGIEEIKANKVLAIAESLS